MENWIIQVLAWIGAFILGVIVNLATPTIKALFQRSSLSLRIRRINAIRDNYAAMKVYREDASKLAVQASKLMAQGFQRLALFIGLCSVIIITGIQIGFNEVNLNFAVYFISVMAGYVTSKFDDVELLIRNSRDFEKYQLRTKKRLKIWGGNPEDLDKEEPA